MQRLKGCGCAGPGSGLMQSADTSKTTLRGALQVIGYRLSGARRMQVDRTLGRTGPQCRLLALREHEDVADLMSSVRSQGFRIVLGVRIEANVRRHAADPESGFIVDYTDLLPPSHAPNARRARPS